MTLPLYLLDFFKSLKAEENISLKKTFEGDFSDVGKYQILTEKYLDNNKILLEKIIPIFSAAVKSKEITDSILDAQKEQIKRNLVSLGKELDSSPGKFYEYQIQREENRLSHLSISSMENEAYSIFEEVIICDIKANNTNPAPIKENYLYTFFLKILYEEYKYDIGLREKYNTERKDNNKLYKYYKSLGIDLNESDRQFSKYDLLSISSSEQIISGLPSRILNSLENSQFLIDTPEPLLNLFILLLDSKAIKNISFLVECEVIFQTSEQYFILLGNEKTKSLVLLTDFLYDNRNNNAIRDEIKIANLKNLSSTQVSAGRFYDISGDSAWYFIDDRNIYFEEIPSDLEVLEDCVVTQLIHIEYFTRDNEIFLSHIDHEYIFYTYDEFDNRLKDFSQKGGARKRIKTFKIDNSEIPLIFESNIVVINTILEYLFKKPYLFNKFCLEIMKNTENFLKLTNDGKFN